jgi:ribosomal protein L7/L12
MVFDVKLKGFDAAAKLKIIKELRTFTNLGRVSARNSLAAAAATNGGMTAYSPVPFSLTVMASVT